MYDCYTDSQNDIPLRLELEVREADSDASARREKDPPLAQWGSARKPDAIEFGGRSAGGRCHAACHDNARGKPYDDNVG